MPESKKCSFCFEEIAKDAVYCKHCKTDLNEEGGTERKTSKKIEETRCTCRACGHVWFYGKQDITLNKANAMSNVGKSLMCCGGCIPALFIPDKKTIDLNKCPKCHSGAVLKEQVEYAV